MELVKSLIVLLCCLSISVIYTHSAVLYSGKPSDLEIGTLGPEDKLLFVITSEVPPLSGLDYVDHGINSSYIEISYVNVTEYGGYPDARAFLLEGGPGFGHVMIRLIPTTAFNYTIDIHGTEEPLIPDGITREYHQFERRHYANEN